MDSGKRASVLPPEIKEISGEEVVCIYTEDATKSQVLLALKNIGLRERGVGHTGNYLFSYSITPKLIGKVQYNPKDNSVLIT